MIRKRKIKPSVTGKVVEEPNLLPIHLLFPFHLSYKDGKEQRECYFKDEIDLKKHITRYNIKTYEVKPTEPKD